VDLHTALTVAIGGGGSYGGDAHDGDSEPDLEIEEMPDEASGQSTANEITIPCRVAAVVHDHEQRSYERTQAVMWALVLIALAGIVAAIVLFFVSDTESAALSSLVAGLLTGPLALFIRTQRDDARDARDAAQKTVQEQCKGQTTQSILETLDLPLVSRKLSA
jgi:hypothetical protein